MRERHLAYIVTNSMHKLLLGHTRVHLAWTFLTPEHTHTCAVPNAFTSLDMRILFEFADRE